MKTYAIVFALVASILAAASGITAGPASQEPGQTVEIAVQPVTDWYEAVGTVRPRTETSIEARVTGQVRQVQVRPGQTVHKGQPMVVLDDRQFRSRLDQARQGLKSAQAAREQARQSISAAEAAFQQSRNEYERRKKFFAAQAATTGLAR